MAIDFSAAREDLGEDLGGVHGNLIGKSDAVQMMRVFARRAGASDATILLQGESGSGKDHLAEVIHHEGRLRGRKGTIVTVDCGSMTETLWESTMFGHTKGAFTDAHKAKTGLVEIADGGTLFFDEVGNLTPSLQAKLLRITEKMAYRPLGCTVERPVKFRVILATNANLKKMVAEKQFRHDLYQRINVLVLELPPLRERLDDVPLLAESFLRSLGGQKTIHPRAMDVLTHYSWPGNVRELRNVITRAHFNSCLNQEIGEEHIALCFDPVDQVEAEDSWKGILKYEDMERKYFISCVKLSRANRALGAKLSGLSPRVYSRALAQFNLNQ